MGLHLSYRKKSSSQNYIFFHIIVEYNKLSEEFKKSKIHKFKKILKTELKYKQGVSSGGGITNGVVFHELPKQLSTIPMVVGCIILYNIGVFCSYTISAIRRTPKGI